MFWFKSKIKNLGDLKEYIFADDWRISVPSNWCYEIDSDDINQTMLYEDNSDLTFRISVMHSEKDGELPPKEIMIKAFLSSNNKNCHISKVKDVDKLGFFTALFSCIYQEGGKSVHRSSFGVADDGTLLTVNIYSTDKLKIKNSLAYLSTVRRS